jgi:hypothetical protein
MNGGGGDPKNLDPAYVFAPEPMLSVIRGNALTDRNEDAPLQERLSRRALRELTKVLMQIANLRF